VKNLFARQQAESSATADLLTSEEPDRNRYIRRLTGAVWNDPRSNAPLNFSGSSNSGDMLCLLCLMPLPGAIAGGAPAIPLPETN